MNRSTAILSILAIVSTTGWAQDKGVKISGGQFPLVGRVSAAQLNVRMAPKSDATSMVVGVLKEGDEVTAVEETDGFYGIMAPKGAWTWIHSKNLDTTGDSATTIADAPVRTDSRMNAPIVATLKAGTHVKVLKENLGWVKVDAGDSVRFWVAKKYIQPTKGSEGKVVAKAPRAEVRAAGDDREAKERIKLAEEMVKQENDALKKGDMAQIDFDAVVALFEEASNLARDPATRSYAENNAKMYRRVQSMVSAVKGPAKALEEQESRIRELMAQANKVRASIKTYQFRGKIDVTGAFMLNRPGTHKLVTDDQKIVCFLKVREGDSKLLEKMNENYEKFVGVNGMVIQNPIGWPGYNVVVVDEVEPISSQQEALFLLGDESTEKR